VISLLLVNVAAACVGDPLPVDEEEADPSINKPIVKDVDDDDDSGSSAKIKLSFPRFDDGSGDLLAFPGAEGHGRYTRGARAAESYSVYRVTNLNTSGEGSFKDAISQPNRIIVFAVSGVINLNKEAYAFKNNQTVLFETAPGDGIELYNGRMMGSGATNLIVRYMRQRMGRQFSGADSGDAAGVANGSDQIYDHCSFSWGLDENFSISADNKGTRPKNITVQNSIIGQGCMNHSCGGLVQTNDDEGITIFRNLLIDNLTRNFKVKGLNQYVNNVIYNWGDNNSYGGEGAWYNMVGNIYKPGPASKDRKYIMDAYGVYTRSDKTTVNYGYAEFYLYGNVHTAYPEITADNVTGIYWHNGTVTPSNEGKIKTAEFAILGSDGSASHITTHSAETAAERIISYGGASLSRDAVDVRACADFRSGTATFPDGGNGSSGGLIDTQAAVGGWPEYTADAEAVSRTLDSDGDGMPDWFEKQFSLDAGDASDAAAKSLDVKGRYTNLEMYLHYLVRNISAGQNEGGSYSR